MIEELQKRPFVRPLFLWITGIVVQLFWGVSSLVVIILFLLLAFTLYAGKASSLASFNYGLRWTWGVIFSLLLITTSVIVTDYADRKSLSETSVSPIEQWAIQKQQAFVESFDQLQVSDAEKSVLATLTIGYRKTMDKGMQRRFSITGVSHILAVSGFHVAIICSFLSLFFCFLPRNEIGKWIKYILMVIFLWCFVLITGLAASAVRAGIMCTLYLTGKILRQDADGYNTLAAAAFCMLAYNPLYLFDIGFQLSYVAVFSILYLEPRFNRLIIVRNPLLATPWSWITVTLAAQTGTTFLCLYYFGQFSTVFLFTNLPLTLLATLLIPSGIIWALLPAGIPGYSLLQHWVELLISSMVWIVERFASFPGASLTFYFDFLLMIIAYILLGLLVYLCKRFKPKGSKLIKYV